MALYNPDVVYRFGAFVLDIDRYELRSAGELVAAEPKVLEVLAYLIAHRDRVVAKEELVQEVWHGQFVSDSAVSRAIREIRRCLGETAASSGWVKTVYGRGFAFAGEVSESSRSVLRSTAGEAPMVVVPEAGQGRKALPSPVTALVGRERELEEVCDLLASARLLTLTGAGGAGKTRLALEVAHRNAAVFAGGTAFVALAEVVESESVATAIARALGTGDAAGGSAAEAVRRHIADQRLLLVLDGFEHVIDARTLVSDLLRACPQLVVLVTSRFVLQVEGEQQYPVPPLALPADDTSEGALEQAPSVALFLDRARAARHDFRPGGKDLAYVAEICRRLDGLPLAIELAAARVKILAPGDLWRRLAERSDLLSAPAEGRPERHRTLELTLGWSYDLLDEAERKLLQCLSVFTAGCTLAAAEQVCRGHQFEVLEALTGLVDKSLVSRLPAVEGEPRFALLETTRAFARDRLDEVEERALRGAHAAWALDLALSGEQHLAGGDQEAWIKRLDAEHGNLLAALNWARSGGDLAVGLATAGALARHWSQRGSYREGRQELEALLSCAEGTTLEPSVRAEALIGLGLLRLLLCDYPAATATLEEAMTILRSLDDRPRLAQALNHLAWVVAQSEALDQAESLGHEALALHRELGNARGASVALNNLGWSAFYRGDADWAEECFAEALVERRRACDDRGVAFALVNLAVLRLHLTERWEELDDWLEEARSLVDRLGDRPLEGWVLCARGGLAGRRGASEEALALLERSAEIGRDTAHPDARAWCQLFLGEVHSNLGDRRRARSRYEAVRQIWDELGVPWGVAQAAWRLAEVARDEGEPEAARELFDESIVLFERMGAWENAEACRRALGRAV